MPEGMKRFKRSVRFHSKEISLLEKIIDSYMGREMDEYEADAVQKLLNMLYVDEAVVEARHKKWLESKGYKVEKVN
jgi:hypothetical protein